MIVGLIVALGLGAAPSGSADQFDLVCNNTSELTGYSTPTSSRTIEFRIDLSLKQACANECLRVFPIKEVLADAIVFEDDVDNREGPHFRRINRVTGEYSGMNTTRSLGMMIVEKGACARAPFKPFPATKF